MSFGNKIIEILETKNSFKLTENDIDYLKSCTKLSKDEIVSIFSEFMSNNPRGKLNKTEYINLVNRLEPENVKNTDKLLEFVFRGFDRDKDGLIDFNEFKLGYV